MKNEAFTTEDTVDTEEKQEGISGQKNCAPGVATDGNAMSFEQ